MIKCDKNRQKVTFYYGIFVLGNKSTYIQRFFRKQIAREKDGINIYC